jgi:hypothetical protein
LTRVRGEYIITIKPIAMGIDIVPMDKLFKKPANPGKTKPKSTPINMDRNIHKVK